MNIISLVTLGLLALSLFFGFIYGFFRGGRKSLFRLIVLAGCVVLALILTPLITKAFTNFAYNSFVKNMLSDMGTEGVDFDEYADIILKLVPLLINSIVFVIVFYILKILSFIVGLFFVKAFVGNKPAKRGTGILIGLATGFLVFVVIMTPVTGYTTVVAEAQKAKWNGEYILKMDDIKLGNFSVDCAEYKKSAGILGSGFWIGNLFFDLTSRTTINKQTIVLTSDVKNAVKAINAAGDLELDFDNFEFDQLLKMDAVKLKTLISALFEVKLVNVAADIALDVLADNLSGAEAGEGGEGFTDAITEALKDPEVRNDIKGEFLRLADVMIAFQKFDFGGEEISIEAISAANSDDIDGLVDAVAASRLFRKVITSLLPTMMEGMIDSIEGFEYTAQKVTVSDWDNEATVLKAIFRSFGSISGILDNADGADGAEGLEKAFSKDNALAMGNFFDSLKKSDLFSGFYGALTKFDDSKSEYVIISTFGDMFGGNVIRGIFEQQTNAIITTPGQPNKNIDFKKFSWTVFLGKICDTVTLVNDLSKLGNGDNPGDISEIIKKLEDPEFRETIKTLLDSVKGEDNEAGFAFLDSIDASTDCDKESKLFDELYSYNGEEGKAIADQTAADKLIDELVKSTIVLPMLKDSKAVMEYKTENMALINNAIASKGGAKTAELNKLFGIIPY